MGVKERILHMLLFEAIALVLLTALAMLIAKGSVLSMSALAICLSLIAMTWNYAFNLGFDRVYGHDRYQRGLKIRVWHGVLFELGMVVLSFPVIMWWLKLGFWAVLLLDIGAVAFFLVYSVVYNWLYDVIKHHCFNKRAVQSAQKK
ncbi:PACE efflux transporter [Agaribacterium sp. ZY112]|uniref:PACE efflux transporter n=1 Tax=Agaribacterium sp. ZY112 TaxID=3233574 RepID=UPI00352670EF